MSAQTEDPIIVRRYARTRLYDPANLGYIDVPQLRAWAAQGISFVVLDAETGAEVTQVRLA